MRTTAIQIHPFGVQSPYLKQAANVYVQTWKRGADWALSFFSRQACAPGFVGYVALVDGDVVGMGFGSHSLPGQWWHDKVAARVGAGHPALQSAWVLTELAVLDGWRGMGIGGMLHDKLLLAQPCPRVLLSTQVDNARARNMYERRGWLYLHPGFAFEPGNPPYLVMHKEL